MALRANGSYSLRFVLLARSIARLTGHVRDQTLSYFPTAGAAGAFAIGWVQRYSGVNDEHCLNHPG